MFPPRNPGDLEHQATSNASTAAAKMQAKSEGERTITPPKEHEFVKGRTKTTSSKEMSVNMLLFFTTLTNLHSKLQGSGR